VLLGGMRDYYVFKRLILNAKIFIIDFGEFLDDDERLLLFFR